MDKDYVPANDESLLDWARQLNACATANYSRWGVESPAALIAEPLAVFSAAMERSSNPNRGKIDVLEKNEAKKTLVKACRTYVQGFLARNPHVTNGDRETMGLHVYDVTHTPIAQPEARPVGTIRLKGTGAFDIHIAPDRDISAEKKSYYGCKIAYELFEHGAPPPTSEKQLAEGRFVRRKKASFVFQPQDSGKRAFFTMRYENSKGDAGPWCQIFSVLIP